MSSTANWNGDVSSRERDASLSSGPFTQSENIGNSTGSKTMKIGPFYFWVISPFAEVQLWTYYCVLNASGLPAIAMELSS